MMQSKNDNKRDDVLRRMLATPPQPKTKPSRPPAPPKGDKPPE